jgi:hypothetical protein
MDTAVVVVVVAAPVAGAVVSTTCTCDVCWDMGRSVGLLHGTTIWGWRQR